MHHATAVNFEQNHTCLFQPNAELVQRLHSEYCLDMFRHIRAIFKGSCTNLYVKFIIKPKGGRHFSLRHNFVITALLKVLKS